MGWLNRVLSTAIWGLPILIAATPATPLAAAASGVPPDGRLEVLRQAKDSQQGTEPEITGPFADKRLSKNTYQVLAQPIWEKTFSQPVTSRFSVATREDEDRTVQPTQTTVPPTGEQIQQTLAPTIRPIVSPAGTIEFEISPPGAEAETPVAQTQQESPVVADRAQSDFLTYPLPQPVAITSAYGWRTHPLTGDRRLHRGIDLGAPEGMPVLASLSGWVVEAKDGGDGYGLKLVVQEGNVRTLYAHLSAIQVSPGQWVQQGQAIAQVGRTGYATGPHLHLELQKWDGQGWQAVDFQPQLMAAQTRLQQSVIAARPVASTPGQPEMRVALQRQTATLHLVTSTGGWIINSQGMPLAYLQPRQTYIATLHASGNILLGNVLLPASFLIQPEANGLIALGDRWYRGRMMISRENQALLAVNWVGLDDYLKGVVGAEVYPSWPMETLKAQAIAARSYALHYRFNPIHAHYDLEDNTRFQAYGGIAAEFATTNQAVNQTQNLILIDTQKRSLPYYAMYAADDELTAYHRRTYGRNSMSQWGAATLGSQGYDAGSILATYYPDAMLGQLGRSTN